MTPRADVTQSDNINGNCSIMDSKYSDVPTQLITASGTEIIDVDSQQLRSVGCRIILKVYTARYRIRSISLIDVCTE